MSGEKRVELNGEWPIVVIGAGPVGLLLANLLASQGLRCLVIEQRDEIAEWSRAIGIMPPSLEILARAGIAEDLIAAGVRVENAVVHDDRGVAGEVDFQDIRSQFKHILSCPQYETQRILEQKLRDHNTARLARGVKLVGLERLDEGVLLQLENLATGSRQTCRAEWVVGCDGSHSTVRNLADFKYSHSRYPHKFVMADYNDTTGWGREAHLFFTRDGSLESFPLPDNRRRWVALVNGEVETKDMGAYLERQARTIGGVVLNGNRDSRIFEFVPERLAVSSLVSGRIVLAGDAAHVMSPIGGQGMNTGFGDADLLSKILPKLLTDDQSNSGKLLRIYNRRRQKSARVASQRAAMGMWVGTRTGHLQSAMRSLLLRAILFKPPLHKKLAPHFSMLTIPHAQADFNVFGSSARGRISEGGGGYD